MSYIRLLEFRLMLLSICKKMSPQYGGIQPLLQVLRLYVPYWYVNGLTNLLLWDCVGTTIDYKQGIQHL